MLDLCQYPLPLGIHNPPYFLLRYALRRMDPHLAVPLHGNGELPPSWRTNDGVFLASHAAYRIVSLLFSASSITRLTMAARFFTSPGTFEKSGCNSVLWISARSLFR